MRSSPGASGAEPAADQETGVPSTVKPTPWVTSGVGSVPALRTTAVKVTGWPAATASGDQATETTTRSGSAVSGAGGADGLGAVVAGGGGAGGAALGGGGGGVVLGAAVGEG